MSFRLLTPLYRNCRRFPRWTSREVGIWDPVVEMESMMRRLPRFFDFPEFPRMYNELDGRGWSQDGSHGSLFVRQVPLRGFEPGDIKVKMAGNKLVVEAKKELKEKGGDETFTSQQFYSSLTLPENVDLKKVSTSISEAGNFKVTAPLLPVEDVVETETEIPVAFEQGKKEGEK